MGREASTNLFPDTEEISSIFPSSIGYSGGHFGTAVALGAKEYRIGLLVFQKLLFQSHNTEQLHNKEMILSAHKHR